MDKAKRKRLEARGWKIGGVEDFLKLSRDEVRYIDLKLRLADALRQRRQRRKLTQKQLAKMIESSQSRVAKMEKGEPTVSVDLLIRSLLVLGTTNRDLAKIVGPTSAAM
ncbi:MAG: helix-turn-helix domain-containing protein [Candidatus Hydrogenedentota bacterium]